jgi:ribosomal protein L29
MAKAKPAQEVKTTEQLTADLAAKRQDLMLARRGLVSGELANPSVIRATRKEIARLLTAIRAAEQTAEGEK